MKQKTGIKRPRNTIDWDNPEWTCEDFARAMTFDHLPAKLREKLSSRKRGPQKAPKKVPVSIRLSPDVVAAFRASGAGWQSRVDDILRANME